MWRRKLFLWLQYPLGQAQPEGRKQKKPKAGFPRKNLEELMPCWEVWWLPGKDPQEGGQRGVASAVPMQP